MFSDLLNCLLGRFINSRKSHSRFVISAQLCDRQIESCNRDSFGFGIDHTQADRSGITITRAVIVTDLHQCGERCGSGVGHVKLCLWLKDIIPLKLERTCRRCGAGTVYLIDTTAIQVNRVSGLRSRASLPQHLIIERNGRTGINTYIVRIYFNHGLSPNMKEGRLYACPPLRRTEYAQITRSGCIHTHIRKSEGTGLRRKSSYSGNEAFRSLPAQAGAD